jgi:hypothetical protein
MARGHHSPGSFAPWAAREGHVLHFQAMQGGDRGLGRPIYCLGVIGGDVCPTCVVIWRRPPLPHCCRLGLGVFCLLCLCILFVSPVQFAFVLPLFYWNICWLVARSVIFYFESEHYCKEMLKCYSCKICVST